AGEPAAPAAAPEAETPADARAPAPEEQFGPAPRIEMTKIDQLLDLASRALVVHGQMGAGLLGEVANSDLMELHQRSERLLMELQDWVIESRMIPVATFFRSHARTVRDAARGQRKRVRLRVEGER